MRKIWRSFQRPQGRTGLSGPFQAALRKVGLGPAGDPRLPSEEARLRLVGLLGFSVLPLLESKRERTREALPKWFPLLRLRAIGITESESGPHPSFVGSWS